MARTSKLLHQGRLFARLDRFVVECPRCGYLIHAYFNQITRALPKGRKPARTRATAYNPITSTVCCPACRRAWGVGLLVYPLAGRVTRRQPDDQKPTMAQLLTMRDRGRGWLMPEEIRGADEMNVFVVADCICPETPGSLDMGCPVHGWVATNERLATLEGQEPDAKLSLAEELQDPPPDPPTE